jgi:hypothetical protein
MADQLLEHVHRGDVVSIVNSLMEDGANRGRLAREVDTDLFALLREPQPVLGIPGQPAALGSVRRIMPWTGLLRPS